MISGQVPNHLIVGARAGFMTAIRNQNPLWQRVAQMVNIDGKTQDFVDLGAAPMPKNSTAGLTVQDFIEKQMSVAAKDWDITTFISYNAVQDDRTGTLLDRVRSAADNFNKHMNKIVFEAINSGASISADYGACYDGLSLFSASHVDKGAVYATAQSNLNALALTPDNFETVYVAASTRVDDQGEQTGFIPNLLVVPPALMREAKQITGNEMLAGTANNDINPWFGTIEQIVIPWIDSTAWYLVAANESQKPILLVMRQQPFLQDSWFDPESPDGGRYYFKYFARYSVAYGDWRPITQGNT